MAFLNDWKNRIGGEFAPPYEISMLGDALFVLAGHKGLYAISDSEIVARVKGGKLRVFGRGLKVDAVSKEEIYVKGEISGVERIYEA